MKLYTRSGDDGTTGLFSGARVSKNHPRIEAYGTVDEFNACLGVAIAACGGRPEELAIKTILDQVQSRLFDIGADLATPEGSSNESKIERITPGHIAEVEHWIDEIDSKNDPLATFIMPAGTELAARLHLARTVCRRAERLMVGLSHSEQVGEALIRYMNRLSDMLFAMARLVNKASGVRDVAWKPSRSK
jgi:cob(I)alamin adenosyltransferase